MDDINPLSIVRAFLSIERIKENEYLSWLNSGDNYDYEKMIKTIGIIEGLDKALESIESVDKVIKEYIEKEIGDVSKRD
jgi:hypothetical protein